MTSVTLTAPPPEFLAAADLLAAREPDSAWRREARPEQLPPDEPWSVWLLCAGRGFGKSTAGAHWLAELARATPGDYGIIARSELDCRQVCLEGQSGLLAALGLTRDSPEYRRGVGQIRLSNGSTIFSYSAESPEAVRGANLSAAWCDELGSWRFADQLWNEVLIPALRLGVAKVCVTTTPRPIKLLRELLSRTDGSVSVTKGTSFENPALSPTALAEWRRRYPEGSRLARQELRGELVAEIEGALWSVDTIDANRVKHVAREDLVKVVVGVDPAMAGGVTGIVTCGVDATGQGYVLADDSLAGTPDQWARQVAKVCAGWEANSVCVEVNQGGALVTSVLRTVDSSLPITTVRAAIGKTARAEPFAALAEQGRISHAGVFDQLEDQLCCWTGQGASPDRLDAMCWAFWQLKPGTSGRAHAPVFAAPPTASRWDLLRPGLLHGA